MLKYAPIVLFAYKRPWHLKQVVEALKQNLYASESKLIIYCDGPKNEKDEPKVKEVRKYVKTINGFKDIEIIEREKNLGLSKSIISGVTEVVNNYDQVIVLEDDLVTSPYFLKYMNDGLNYYKDYEQVVSLHGYLLPIEEELPFETFFLKGAECWGWATWKRGWQIFEHDGTKLLNELKERNLTFEFDLEGAYPYTQMLQHQIEGKVDSWAIRWLASAYLKDMLTLYPSRSLVNTIGTDASGTHCENTNVYNVKLSQTPIQVGNIEIKQNDYARELIKRYYFKCQTQNWDNRSLIRRIIDKIKRLVHAK